MCIQHNINISSAPNFRVETHTLNKSGLACYRLDAKLLCFNELAASAIIPKFGNCTIYVT